MENEISYNFGFIITRHVNSERTNNYWNKCVNLIKHVYPLRPIVIIDDNSKKEFVKEWRNYENVTIISSEYPGRGELLPFVYLLKYKWFEKAVVLHDSLFVHERIPIELFNSDVIPLWHHPYDAENLANILRIVDVLKNNNILIKKLLKDKNFNLCFGCQCFITLPFLEKLQQKYQFTNLIHVVTNRTDRCALERVIGLLFHLEQHNFLKKYPSLFGNIKSHFNAFYYNYEHYIHDYNLRKIIQHKFVKVWTGR
jgi:hypothetical protein